MGDFFSGKLPGKIATVFALLVLSRVGTYIPISGVDRAAFAESLAGGGGMMGYVDTLTGGSISKLGIFSLGIVPYINSSIIFQLLGSVFPELKKLQKEEGEAGRRQFQQYQRCVYLRLCVCAFGCTLNSGDVTFRSRSIELYRATAR